MEYLFRLLDMNLFRLNALLLKPQCDTSGHRLVLFDSCIPVFNGIRNLTHISLVGRDITTQLSEISYVISYFIICK